MASAELQDLLEMFAERAMANAEITPTLEERRTGINLMGKRFENLEGISTEAVDADGVPAEWVLAEGTGNGVILYLHGGGYVTGSVISHRGMASNLSRASDCRVLNVDYRLAPEHKHPAQVEDAHTAYRWLLNNDIDSSSINSGCRRFRGRRTFGSNSSCSTRRRRPGALQRVSACRRGSIWRASAIP